MVTDDPFRDLEIVMVSHRVMAALATLKATHPFNHRRVSLDLQFGVNKDRRLSLMVSWGLKPGDLPWVRKFIMVEGNDPYKFVKELEDKVVAKWGVSMRWMRKNRGKTLEHGQPTAEQEAGGKVGKGHGGKAATSKRGNVAQQGRRRG